MSIVFLGTSEFAAAILERLAASASSRPVLVITRPDRPSGRGRRLTAPPVAELARSLGIALQQPENINHPQARALIARAGDAQHGQADGHGVGDRADGHRQTVIVCAFGALIKEPLLSEHELLNVHPSLLPRWRGAAPIERAIMAGDAQTGVSIMRLTAGLDSGPVCLVGAEPIRSDDDFASLSTRLQALGGELIVRALEQSPTFIEQPEAGVTYAEKLGPDDRLLDPARTAIELERVVRALHPHIGARVALADGTLLGVHRAAIAQAPSLSGRPAGGDGAATVSARPAGGGGASSGQAGASGPLVREGRLVLDCAAGVLELLVVQPPGKRTMDAADYLRGRGSPARQ